MPGGGGAQTPLFSRAVGDGAAGGIAAFGPPVPEASELRSRSHAVPRGGKTGPLLRLRTLLQGHDPRQWRGRESSPLLAALPSSPRLRGQQRPPPSQPVPLHALPRVSFARPLFRSSALLPPSRPGRGASGRRSSVRGKKRPPPPRRRCGRATGQREPAGWPA